VRATVDSAIRLPGGRPPGTTRALRQALSVANPALRDLARVRRRTEDLLERHPESRSLKRKLQRITWALEHAPRTLSAVSQDEDGALVIARGAWFDAQHVLQVRGDPLDCDDHRVLAPTDALQLADGVELRGYQVDAVAQAARRQQGYIVMPTGAGKTVTGVGIACACGQQTLVVAHTGDLLEQWVGAFERFAGVEAGVIAGGRRVRLDAPAVVATVQSLQKLEPEDLDELLGGFGLIIIDEAHHTPAASFTDLVSRCPAHYRIGLTATPEREDGLTPLLWWTLGPLLAEVEHEQLVADGHLIVPEVRLVETDFDFEWTGPDDYNACLQALVEDPDRNRLAAGLVTREARAGHLVLVLSQRQAHCAALAEAAQADGVEAAVLTSTTGKRARREILERFRAGELPVVCATQLADEGLDVPKLDRVVLATPSRAQGRTIQRLGRLMRPAPGKAQPVLYDLVDRRVGVLRNQWRRRQEAYRKVLGVQGRLG